MRGNGEVLVQKMMIMFLHKKLVSLLNLLHFYNSKIKQIESKYEIKTDALCS